MSAANRKLTFKGGALASPSSRNVKQTRNLKQDQLGGVVFGCTDNTINECLSKQIFGLPSQHFSYVKNISPGLPLFLFNYSKRALHGIFEAASSGQMNINPYGWTINGSERTSFPAQVQIRVRMNCRPLLENQFAAIIEENYYTPTHIWFELDYAQVSKLISLFSTQVIPVAPPSSIVRNVGNWQIKHRHPSNQDTRLVITPSDGSCSHALPDLLDGHLYPDGVHQSVRASMDGNEEEQREEIYEKLQKLSVNSEPSDSSPKKQDSSSLLGQRQDSANVSNIYTERDDVHKTEVPPMEHIKDSPLSPSDFPFIITQLLQEVQELKTFRQEHTAKISQLEKKLTNSESAVKQLRDRCMMLESLSNQEAYTYGETMESSSELSFASEDRIFILGGYDGKSWLSSLDAYSPSRDRIKSLRSMSSVRSYASVAKWNDDLYVIGGGAGSLWYNTVECYNTVKDDWTSLPCLNKEKGSLAAATLHEKIYAFGGGNGLDSFSDVDMFDLNVGRWIPARSMLQKRFALAGVELNGALYAVGGYDGESYLSSGERFDPREYSWSKIGSMNTRRGGHSLVVLNEKLYAIGGFDGSQQVASVDVFDPRLGTWMPEAPMNYARGYSTAVGLNNTLLVIGGLEDDVRIVDKVERYEEGRGWLVTNLRAMRKRCYASAIVF